MAMKYVYGCTVAPLGRKTDNRRESCESSYGRGNQSGRGTSQSTSAALSEVNISDALKSAMTMTAAPAVAAPAGPAEGNEGREKGGRRRQEEGRRSTSRPEPSFG